MKDFLNYLLTIPKRIGIYFAKRRALREHRAAVEHARKVELAQKTIELVQATAAGMVAMMDARARLEAAKRTKFPPGGIAAPGTGPEVDVREWVALPFDRWYRRRDGKVATEKEMLEEEQIRKAAEQWREFGGKPKRPDVMTEAQEQAAERQVQAARKLFDDKLKKMEDRTEEELRALSMAPEEVEERKAFRSDDDRI